MANMKKGAAPKHPQKPIFPPGKNGQKIIADGIYGTWNKVNTELWDYAGNDWNGFTHFTPLPDQALKELEEALND